MFGIGATELIIIMVVALLVFGPKRLPELARSLGRGMAEFRRASSDLRQTLQEAEPPDETPKPLEPPAENIGPPSTPPESADSTESAEPDTGVAATTPSEGVEQSKPPSSNDEPGSRSG